MAGPGCDRQDDLVTYPSWSYFPRNVRPPAWAESLIEAVSHQRAEIDTAPVRDADSDRLTSDFVLARLRASMEELGHEVESGKSTGQKITRPVLFGDDGRPEVSYDIDAFHNSLGIAVEVEAGRGSNGNADCRDIVRTSLLLDARYFVLFMPITYRFKSSGRMHEIPGYAKTRGQRSEARRVGREFPSLQRAELPPDDPSRSSCYRQSSSNSTFTPLGRNLSRRRGRGRAGPGAPSGTGRRRSRRRCRRTVPAC